MKSRLVFIVLLLFITKSKVLCQNKDSSGLLNISVEVIGKGSPVTRLTNGQPDGLSDFNNYFALLTVANNKDSVIHLNIMRCAWGTSWICNNDSIGFTFPGCDMDYPSEIMLYPHKAMKFYALLRPKYNLRNNKFKLGFNILTKEDLMVLHQGPLTRHPWSKAREEEELKIRMRGKIYWSDEIVLKDNLYKYKIGTAQ